MVFFSLSWRLRDLLWEYHLLCWKHENGNIMRPLVSSYLFLGKSVSWLFCWIPSMLDVIRAHAYCLKLVSLEIQLLIQASSLRLAIILTLFQSCCLVTPPAVFKEKKKMKKMSLALETSDMVFCWEMWSVHIITGSSLPTFSAP